MSSAIEEIRGAEPEPLLARFLGKYELDAAVISEEGIEVHGITLQNKPFGQVRRIITAQEIDQVEEWIKPYDRVTRETPVVHLNMKLLRPLRAKMSLSPKPLL